MNFSRRNQGEASKGMVVTAHGWHARERTRNVARAGKVRARGARLTVKDRDGDDGRWRQRVLGRLRASRRRAGGHDGEAREEHGKREDIRESLALATGNTQKMASALLDGAARVRAPRSSARRSGAEQSIPSRSASQDAPWLMVGSSLGATVTGSYRILPE